MYNEVKKEKTFIKISLHEWNGISRNTNFEELKKANAHAAGKTILTGVIQKT